MSSTAALTLTHIMGIIPRQDVFQVDINKVITSTYAIMTSLDTEYLRKWWHKKISPASMLLYVNDGGEVDASETSLLRSKSIQPQITTISNSCTVLTF